MADLFSSGGGGDDVQPDEFYRGLSYLGKPTSITLPGTEPSPPGGGPPLGAAGGPNISAPSVMGTGAAGAPGVSSPSGGPLEGLPPALRALMSGVGFANRVSNVDERIQSALAFPSADAMQTPSGQLTTSAPEILRGFQFPDFPASAVPDFPGVGIEAAGAEAGTAGIGELVGQAAPYIGALTPLISSLAQGGPQGDKGIANLLIDMAGGAAAPFTFGASAAAGGIARGIEDLLAGAPWYMALADFGGLGWLASLLNKQGPYVPKRQEAATTARGDVEGLASGFKDAAASGDPAQELAALQTQSGDVSATPGRNPVRTQLDLPPEVATQLGLSGGPGFQWSSLTPGQFSQFLSLYGSDPTTGAGYVQGSGDVAYLPQAQAEQVARNAQDLTNQYLQYLTTQTAPPEPSPEVAPVAGGGDASAAAMSFPSATTSGEKFPFQYV